MKEDKQTQVHKPDPKSFSKEKIQDIRSLKEKYINSPIINKK